MQITIKPDAKTYLDGKLTAGDRLFLALDDGSSKFSKLGGSCAIGNKFQLVIATAADPDYTVAIDNDAGYQLTTAAPETMYLGAGLILDYQLGTLALRDNSGILDGAVTIGRAAPLSDEEVARRAEMASIGDKIC
ncbi:iron-sulfur cluster biosynthesis family protein [Lacticaseibacillus parakribbianus]|uniref:iron-sulfur cluster biosynthesis family protein n=1 Tax=Lacticaseibacillus parakribbianus TaxID=2970927 RepID=UPI0021CB8EC6|nr:iron-sulfur cluster biosynthesis family protein [Lacticaseibacillus parakribbianus]